MRPSGRSLAFLVVLTLLALAPPASARGTATGRNRAIRPTVRSDFNGDGFADLAVGVPQESVGSVGKAGAVNVIYGSPTGLRATGNQLWTQNSPGVPTVAEANGTFGTSVAAGDFNGDGFSDLAVGVPGATING